MSSIDTRGTNPENFPAWLFKRTPAMNPQFIAERITTNHGFIVVSSARSARFARLDSHGGSFLFGGTPSLCFKGRSRGTATGLFLLFFSLFFLGGVKLKQDTPATRKVSPSESRRVSLTYCPLNLVRENSVVSRGCENSSDSVWDPPNSGSVMAPTASPFHFWILWTREFSRNEVQESPSSRLSGRSLEFEKQPRWAFLFPNNPFDQGTKPPRDIFAGDAKDQG